MSRTLYARLVAYRAFGERLGVLPEPVSFNASLLHNDSGALNVEYSALSAGAGLLDRQLTDGLEIALEVSDGNGYTEPDNARFVITGRSGKTDDRTGTVKYTGQCIQWLLSKARMLDTTHLLTDGDNKGKRPFYSSNPGVILKTLMDENAARGGVAAGLTLGFDTAKDAGGDGWAKKYTLYYSLGVDLQSALSSLVQGGGCDWRTSGRRLDLYNADSGKLSRDLSKSVILQLGRDISEAPYDESISSLASTILVEGDNELVFTLDNPAAPHPWGKWEDYVSQGGVSDKATATAFMQTKLADAARVRGQYTRSVITTGDITSLPLVDYHPGDWITAPTVSHSEKTRVQEIDVSMRQGDGLTVSLALNDVKYDASVRQSKRMQGITGGASLAGSQGGKAASEHDHRVAAAPAGLTATTTAYLDSTGHARGLATVQWAAVTTATDGTALEISGYTVEWRKHVDGAPWHAAGTTDKLTLGISPLDCGTQVEIRVRANATYSDQPGAWADPVVVTVENDVTPCSVPSKPVLSSALGVVTIHWDGKTDAGASMESDFDHIEVGKGATAAGMQVISATQAGQGDYVITGLAIGSQHSYALRSVDHAGNRSAWSAIASVTVASAVPQETLDSINKDIAKAEAEAKAAKTTADGKNKVFTQAVEPAHSGLTNGDLWQKLDASGHISSVNIWNGSKFVAYSLVADSLLVPGSVNGSVLIKDGSVEAKNIKIGNGEILTELLKARKIVTDDVAAGQFRGYVFTGSVFQSSESADTGIKINSTALQMWDRQHHRTVYLDGEGKNNVLTGSFQTATNGDRVEINSNWTTALMGGEDTYSGKAVVFRNDDLDGFPVVQGLFASGNRGYSPRLDLHSGWKTDHDPAAALFLESRPRTKGATGSGITSFAQIMADTDYTEADKTKKSKAYLLLNGIGGSGATATLTAYAYYGDTAKTWVTAKRNDGVTEVGIGADAFTRTIYLGGKIGGITGQRTFQVANWKYVTGVGPHETVGVVSVALSPAKYGVYHAVANADCAWGSMFVHVASSGSASKFQVIGYNAGDGSPSGDVWVDAIAWLT